jgi:hypothetical protein
MATPLIGTSESIERSRELIDYVADTGLHVIITGEIVNSRCYYDAISSNRMVGLNITFRTSARYLLS